MTGIAKTENGRKIELRHLLFVLSLCLLIAPSAWGDYQDGRKAYNRGDYTTALKELRPLAEQGHAGSQYLLGYMYYKGRGVGQDGEEAVKWVREAAEQDYDQAQHILPMLLNETEVDSDPEKIYQILWDEFDRHYVFFKYKNINF